jgi:acyl-CoA synthetase (AMP-forming)/AMP-acid ligase II
LESVLLGHPEVRDSAVFAMKCQKLGEVPAAWVVLQPGVHADKVSFFAAQFYSFTVLQFYSFTVLQFYSFTVQWTLHNGIALGQTISDPINQVMLIIRKLASTYVRHDRMIWDL